MNIDKGSFICTVGAQGALSREGVRGIRERIQSTVSDAILRGWLWATAINGCPMGYIGSVIKVIDN